MTSCSSFSLVSEANDEREERRNTPSWVWVAVLVAAAGALLAYLVYMAFGMPGMDHGGSGTNGSMLH